MVAIFILKFYQKNDSLENGEECLNWSKGRSRKAVAEMPCRFESCLLRQLGNEVIGSPSTRARQPTCPAEALAKEDFRRKLDFLSLPSYCGAGQKRAFPHFLFDCFYNICYHYIERIIYHLHTIKLLKIWQQKST